MNGWRPPALPSTCVCGTTLCIEHALCCPRGGFTIIGHNEIRDFTADLMKNVCRNVATEPTLQSLSGELLQSSSAITTDNASLDIQADGFWDCGQQRAFFDVRVFNPIAHTYYTKYLSSCYRRHELEKRRSYEDRVINVEHGCFSPLVFSTAGGLGPTATVVFKRLASLLAVKVKDHYSKVLSWIGCKINFALIRSSIMCLHGTHTLYHPDSFDSPNIDLALSEGRVTC